MKGYGLDCIGHNIVKTTELTKNQQEWYLLNRIYSIKTAQSNLGHTHPWQSLVSSALLAISTLPLRTEPSLRIQQTGPATTQASQQRPSAGSRSFHRVLLPNAMASSIVDPRNSTTLQWNKKVLIQSLEASIEKLQIKKGEKV